MKKVFATDYDGTLFQSGTVSKDDIEAIKAFRKRGGVFGIATGRFISSIQQEIETYGIPVDFIIGVNGAVTVDKHINELDSIGIDNGIGFSIYEHLKNQGAIHYSISDGYDLHNGGEHSEELLPFQMELSEIMDGQVRGIFSRMPSRAEAIEICNQINEKYGDHVKALPNFQYLDIASVHTDKSVALEKYLKHFGDVMVGTAGDAHNDLQMLQNYHGYAMHHGDEDIVSLIENKAHSVKEALEKFMSIDN